MTGLAVVERYYERHHAVRYLYSLLPGTLQKNELISMAHAICLSALVENPDNASMIFNGRSNTYSISVTMSWQIGILPFSRFALMSLLLLEHVTRLDS